MVTTSSHPVDMPHPTPSSARHTLASQDALGPDIKKRHRTTDTLDAAPKPLNRKRFLRFLKTHELKFGLTPVARDEATGEVTLVVCRFCQNFGREQQPNKQRRSTRNVKYFQNSFRTDQYQQHHEISHCEMWRRYRACSDEEKRVFFLFQKGATLEMQTSAEKFRVKLAPEEVWALEPTKEEKRKCFRVASAIAKVAEVLAIDATEATVDNISRKRSHHLISHVHESTVDYVIRKHSRCLISNAHELTLNAVAKWCPPEDTFQSCDLVGTIAESFYRIVVYSRSQIDCLVELAAAGLSFRQISSTMRSFRSHAPMLLCDLVESKDLGTKNVAAAVDTDFQGVRNASPQYTEEQTAEFVRLIIAANLNVTSRLLHGCWAFSLVLRASMENAPMRSYLEFRVKVYGQGAMHNVHLVSIPAFENKCKSMMYDTLEQVLNAVLPNWRHHLIGVATEGNSQMLASVLDIVARLQNEAAAPVVYRSTSSCYQLDCIVTKFYSSLQDDCFLSGLKELSAYIRRQPELLARMTPPPLSPGDTNSSLSSLSSKERWIALGKETNWIAAHRSLLSQHLEVEKPPSAPDNSWWLFFAAVDWVANLANETFAKLLRNHTTFADQIASVVDLSTACAAAFHAQGPLNDSPLAVDLAHSKICRSRNGHFALSKPGVIAFILEINAPSVVIISTTEVPMIDLAAENLAISAANMIESLLDLSTALGDERSPSSSRKPSDPKMTEFLPPMLPHELVQLSGSEFTSLLRMYSPIVRTVLSEEDIVMMNQELQALRRAAIRESILSAALVKCNADTPFQEAWALTEHRFKLLEGFAGGFASVFSCTPVATHGSTSDLALCRSEMNTDRVLLANFSLEGTLHAQQFPVLMALNEKIDSKSS